MYVWEVASGSLRVSGWNVWHSAHHDPYGLTHTVLLQRVGAADATRGPTLNEGLRRGGETGV
jgi:hypothetical protein